MFSQQTTIVPAVGTLIFTELLNKLATVIIV
jgi:hypothetical protein